MTVKITHISMRQKPHIDLTRYDQLACFPDENSWIRQVFTSCKILIKFILSENIAIYCIFHFYCRTGYHAVVISFIRIIVTSNPLNHLTFYFFYVLCSWSLQEPPAEIPAILVICLSFVLEQMHSVQPMYIYTMGNPVIRKMATVTMEFVRLTSNSVLLCGDQVDDDY